MISKLNLNPTSNSNKNFLFTEEKEQNPSNPIMRWVGIADLIEGGKAYPKKEYQSAFMCAMIGLTKIGILTAACYGTYQWAFGNPIHLSELITEADNIFQQRSNDSFAPNAVDRLIEALYSEQRTFKMWPQSGKDFFIRHLNLDYPMSAAIIEKMLIKAAEHGDSSFNGIAIKDCGSATYSTTSCIQAAKTLIQNANQDGLSTAMSILTKCKKHSNEFCDTAMMNGMKLAIEQNQFSDISTLANKLLKGHFSIEAANIQQFTKNASDLFFQEIESKQQKIDDCRMAAKTQAKKGSENWNRCYAHANFWDHLDEMDRPWNFEERFLNRKPGELEAELQSDLQNGESIAILSSTMQGSSQFIVQLFNSFIQANMMNEAMRLLEKNPSDLQSMILPMIEQLKDMGRWDAGLQFILNISKKHPNFNIDAEVQAFTQDLLKSSESHLAFTILYLPNAIELFDVKAILQKVFENREENHLHKIYLLAKSWIAKKDPKYDEHLKFLIEQMFAQTSNGWSYYTPFNVILAKALVTKWILSKDPNRWSLLDLSPSWDLNSKDGSRWDYYHSTINQANWQQLLASATK